MLSVSNLSLLTALRGAARKGCLLAAQGELWAGLSEGSSHAEGPPHIIMLIREHEGKLDVF